MSQFLTNKIVSLVDSEVDYSEETKTKLLSFANYQSAKLCFAVAGADEESTANTNITINAVLEDGTKKEIRKQEIELRTASITDIDFVADELAHDEASKIEIVVDAIEDSEFKGNIFAILGNARYDIENDDVVSENTEEVTENDSENTENTENNENNTDNSDNTNNTDNGNNDDNTSNTETEGNN